MKSKMLDAVIETIKTVQDIAKRHDLGSQTVVTLLAVANAPASGISLADLAVITGLSASSVSRNISRLSVGLPGEEGLGLVELTSNPMDRRQKYAALTTSGRVLMEAIDLRAGAICRAG